MLKLRIKLPTSWAYFCYFALRIVGRLWPTLLARHEALLIPSTMSPSFTTSTASETRPCYVQPDLVNRSQLESLKMSGLTIKYLERKFSLDRDWRSKLYCCNLRPISYSKKLVKVFCNLFKDLHLDNFSPSNKLVAKTII